MRIKIVGVTGSNAGQTFDLAGEVVVGRDAECAISVAGDPAVSRRHARFTYMQGLPMIEDLSSRNGTFLNGARITQARPVSSGNEVRVGAQVFRVEAELDSVPGQPPLVSGPRKEVSRGERRASGRRGERSTAEGTLYQNVGGADGPGCALPTIDVSGCLKYLWIILLVLLAAIAIAIIVWGLGALMSGVAGMGSSAPSQGSSAGPTSPEGENGGGGGGGGSQPPSPAQVAQAEGIRIDEVQLDFAKRDGPDLRPVVLVKWTNLTKEPVVRLFGTIQVFDREGKLLAEIPRETIYHGRAVNPGEEHQDERTRDGIVIQRRLSGIPASAMVKVERVE